MRKTRAKRNIAAARMDVLTAFLLFGLIFVRYCYYGFTYYEQFDDYTRYSAFGGGGLGELFAALSAQPLTSACDSFLWSRFAGKLIGAVAVISGLYAVSGAALHAVFRRRFGTGHLFYGVYALLPLGFEGSYWLSASSRIVPALFFAALSLLSFDHWCESGKKSALVLFAALQFICFCFYEQVALFSAAATLVVMFAVPKSRRRRAQGGWLFLGNGLLYFLLARLLPAGGDSGKALSFLDLHRNGSLKQNPAWEQIGAVFQQGGAGTLGKGLKRGFELFVTEPNYIYILFVLTLAFSFYVAARNTHRTSVRFFAEFLSGFFLAVVPLAGYLFLKLPNFAVRNAIPAFCGLALVADALSDLVFGNMRNGEKKSAVFAAVLAALCCVSSVSELHDYRATTLSDTRICTAAGRAITDLRAPVGERRVVFLLNVEPSYLQDGNFFYREHDYGVSSNAEAMTDTVAILAKRPAVADGFLLTPCAGGEPLAASDAELVSAAAYWYDGTAFVPVTLEKETEVWQASGADGRIYAALEKNAAGKWALKVK